MCRNPLVKDQNRVIRDMVYYWPMYTDTNTTISEPIMIFSRYVWILPQWIALEHENLKIQLSDFYTCFTHFKFTSRRKRSYVHVHVSAMPSVIVKWHRNSTCSCLLVS